MMMCTARAFTLVVLIILYSVLMGFCVEVKWNRNEGIERYHQYTKLPIAINDLLKIYENEHYYLCKKEVNEKNVTEWPFLEWKNLDECCLKYIDLIKPRIKIHGITGTLVDALLQYNHETIQDHSVKRNSILIVKCERQNVYAKYYYMARAPELDCFYSLLRNPPKSNIYNIINKHCGFEWPPDNIKGVTYKNKKEIIEKLHDRTGEPIAKSEYICEYEQEHQVLFKQEAILNTDHLPWPYVMKNVNLNEYCCQYLQRSCPRKLGNIKGVWRIGLLQYQNDQNRTPVKIVVVQCVIQRKSERFFYITRAPTNNCVYALIRRKCKESPFEIIFKHCVFEDLKEKLNVPKCCLSSDLSSLPKFEIKEE